MRSLKGIVDKHGNTYNTTSDWNTLKQSENNINNGRFELICDIENIYFNKFTGYIQQEGLNRRMLKKI